MAVSKQALLEVLGALNRKYRGNGVVTNVSLQVQGTSPSFVMQGPSKLAPVGMPAGIKINDPSGKQVVVPVVWAQNAVRTMESQGEKVIWAGPPAPLLRRPVEQFFPGEQEKVVTAGDVPFTDQVNVQVAVDGTGPLHWWTKSFDVLGCICCTYYDQEVIALQYQVPPDYSLVVDGWTFFVDNTFLPGEIFEVSFRRDGENLLTFEEAIIDPANPDPGQRCLFTGSTEQTTGSYVRIDRNQTLQVILRPRGTFPFAKPPFSSYCGNICVLLHGHRLNLMDNRDGSPRPRDVGEIRDLFDPADVIASVKPEEVQWINRLVAGSAQVDS